MTIEFPATPRQIRPHHADRPKTPGTYWSIHEFQLYAPMKPGAASAAAANSSVKR